MADHLDIFNRLATDQKSVAERQWRESAKPSMPQRSCDIGLFSDEHKQTDLFSNANMGTKQ